MASRSTWVRVLEVESLGQVLAQQAVGVLVARALPGRPGVAEVDLNPAGGGEPLVFGHLFCNLARWTGRVAPRLAARGIPNGQQAWL